MTTKKEIELEIELNTTKLELIQTRFELMNTSAQIMKGDQQRLSMRNQYLGNQLNTLDKNEAEAIAAAASRTPASQDKI